ncbi:type III-B CRISPR module-associated protein Cmr5 [Paenibacillus faecalis]|uniref:type III-B CRISPR module-associated protein Cmr5 n=1 Tax=Paenibacillus faecalis TaxID=2079532 RepID=UPI000D0FD605|nr:type III-B CRISPR module-associated protein Cmr5 [Paenibacillus faecalis]
MKSIDHHYSSIAYNCITGLKTDSRQSYGSVCHKFPSMVMLNGLRLTVAYFNSRSNDEQAAYKQYIQHMGQALGVSDLERNMPESSTEYRYLSQNALRASVWFKRYAEAILKVKESQD